MPIPKLRLALVLATSVGCSAPLERTVVYDERFGDETAMDLYLPDDGETHGTVVFVHGGAWRFFHKERFRSVGRRLARAGYVAVSVEYRLLPGGTFPRSSRDVACAVSYVQHHAGEFGVDPARIALMGYSAGGHLTALLAVDPANPEFTADCAEGPPVAPEAVISVAGPMDLFSLADVDVLHDFLGGTASEVPSIYSLASPIAHVTADDPPFLFIHGSHDLLVPVSNSYDMRDALRTFDIEANVLEMRGSGHIANSPADAAEIGVVAPYDSTEAWIAIMAFLERHIGAP